LQINRTRIACMMGGGMMMGWPMMLVGLLILVLLVLGVVALTRRADARGHSANCEPFRYILLISPHRLLLASA